MSNHNSLKGLAEGGWGIKSFLCEEWRNFTYFVLSTKKKILGLQKVKTAVIKIF